MSSEPRIALLERCWELSTPTGKPIYCEIYRVDGPGVELRCGFSEEDVLQRRRVSDPEHARHLAEQWRLAVLAKEFPATPG